MSHLDQLSLVIPLWVGTILWSTACLEPYDSCKQLSHRRSQRGTWDLDPQGSGKKLHNRPSCATGTNIGLYVKDLCLVSLNVNVTKYYMPQKCQKWQICGYKVCFFQALNIPKLVFVRAPSRTPLGDLTTLPASVISPPPEHKIPGYDYQPSIPRPLPLLILQFSLRRLSINIYNGRRLNHNKLEIPVFEDRLAGPLCSLPPYPGLSQYGGA